MPDAIIESNIILTTSSHLLSSLSLSQLIQLVIGNLLSTYETIAVTLMALLAPRMLVNIRSEFYAQTKPMEKTISWNVAEVAASSTTSERDASGSHA